mmetsp:Transcript_3976/g.18098  ORF Transcript_3976/g.18098 Transcript_3976/m.18098 type:complete len:389 (-) Transcript_3976:912-2078(-)
MRSNPDFSPSGPNPSPSPPSSAPSRIASSGVGTNRNSRHNTRSTCNRVVQLSIMHATRSFHSSDHKISSNNPNGDLGGDHHSAPPSPVSPPRLSSDPPGGGGGGAARSSNGSGASLNGERGSPRRLASRRALTGSVPTKSSIRAGHNAALKRSVASSSPLVSGRASRTPDPPCVERTAPRPMSSGLGAGATCPRALAPVRLLPWGLPRPRTRVPGLPTFVSLRSAAPAQSKSSIVSLPSPPPPLAFIAAGPALRASTPSLARTSAPSSKTSPSGDWNRTRHGSDFPASHPPSSIRLLRLRLRLRTTACSMDSSSEDEPSSRSSSRSSSTSSSSSSPFLRFFFFGVPRSFGSGASTRSARHPSNSAALPFAAAHRVLSTNICRAGSYSR